jgi:hypothetical protein
VATVADIIEAATERGEAEAAAYLATLDPELPLDLVLRKLDLFLEEQALLRRRRMLQESQGRRVGVLLPVPPHIVDHFLDLDPPITLLLPGDHHVPHDLREIDIPIVRGRACRAGSWTMEALLFEAVRSRGGLLAAPEVSEIVDPRLLGEAVRLYAHLRPHARHDDQPLHPDAAARVVVF